MLFFADGFILPVLEFLVQFYFWEKEEKGSGGVKREKENTRKQESNKASKQERQIKTG